jgi:hypothetical protein
MKRLVVCCDGTWNTPDQSSGGDAAPTNITKIALQVAERDAQRIEQRVYYDRGVGTGRLDHLAGGIFGLGLTKNVKQAYAYLVECFEPDDEVYLFGFSRGAYTARSLAGLIRNSGLLRPEYRHKLDDAYALYRDRTDQTHPTEVAARLFRRTWSREIPIHFIGVFDTVGALGVPGLGVHALTRRWQFHDTDLSSSVRHAAQALALHERRGPFRPTLWKEAPDRTDPVRQVWFTGVHSDVGGGYPEPDLAEIPLRWMVERATAAGLEFRPGAFLTSLDGATAEMRCRGERTAPSTWGRRHESRTFPYTVVRRFVRTYRGALGGVQEVASTARVREDDPDRLGDHPSADPSFTGVAECVVGPCPCRPGLRNGETMTATVCTGRRWTGTGIVLEGGAGYGITAFGTRCKGSVPEVPEGCERTDRRGFALIGSVGADTYVVSCRWQDQGGAGWGLVCRARRIGTDHGAEPGRVEIRVTRRP